MFGVICPGGKGVKYPPSEIRNWKLSINMCADWNRNRLCFSVRFILKAAANVNNTFCVLKKKPILKERRKTSTGDSKLLKARVYQRVFPSVMCGGWKSLPAATLGTCSGIVSFVRFGFQLQCLRSKFLSHPKVLQGRSRRKNTFIWRTTHIKTS